MPPTIREMPMSSFCVVRCMHNRVKLILQHLVSNNADDCRDLSGSSTSCFSEYLKGSYSEVIFRLVGSEYRRSAKYARRDFIHLDKHNGHQISNDKNRPESIRLHHITNIMQRPNAEQFRVFPLWTGTESEGEQSKHQYFMTRFTGMESTSRMYRRNNATVVRLVRFRKLPTSCGIADNL